MTPLTELARLFADIPRPDPLSAAWTAAAKTVRDAKPIDPVDADEAMNGVCAQGDDECAI